MKNNIPFTQAQFVLSAVSHEQFPHPKMIDGTIMPEICIVGRSNVGKSSLINHLLRNKKVAKTSSTPGKTQALNFFTVDDRLSLVDLPGYGFAKVPSEMKTHWATTIETYLQGRQSLKLILFLIDSRRMPTEEDCAFIKWASFNQKPFLLVFTKSDKLNDYEKKKNALTSLEVFQNFIHHSPIHFLHFSIKDPRARIELIDHINNLLKS